jgi:hypothetical protein
MNDKKHICRIPWTHVLYAHLLGLSLGYISTIILTLPNLSSTEWLFSICYLILFGLATYYLGGILVLIAAIAFLLPLTFEGCIGQLIILLKWYFLFYVAGAAFALLYNLFLFWYIKIFNKRILKISFAYNSDKSFNIIKSPIPDEAVKISQSLKIDPLYDYNVDRLPEHPYTILFVANPKVCKRKEPSRANLDREQFEDEVDRFRNQDASYIVDPIINDKKLFYRTVDRALHSFENDEVLGRPEIWSCVRVVTIFDPCLADEIVEASDNTTTTKQFGFAEAYQTDIPEKEIVFENLLVPLAHTHSLIKKKWKGYNNKIDFKEVDVIYIISANEDYTRASAMYSDKQNGIIYSGDPPVLTVSHDEYTDAPGLVALNALTAWQKTYIHEFGHAMSAFQNGAIIDEYMDYNETSVEASKDLQAVNRLERKKPKDPNDPYEPIPSVFARYKNFTYHSDRDHPSALETWKSYFPQRCSKYIYCTMDRTYGEYQFDPLISDFMFDRLMVKCNRK